MELTTFDGALLVYNYAVILSGGAIVLSLDVQSRTGLLVIGLLVAVFWTGYFKFVMIQRLPERQRE
ncbi:hypothetical protein [Natronorubrum sp. DTA7]|uniref:hypothetical protein n=1 Tax=Natronorubrum sp. DTA7 TaxID=3447016 RepID=UPI003F8658E2